MPLRYLVAFIFLLKGKLHRTLKNVVIVMTHFLKRYSGELKSRGRLGEPRGAKLFS